MLTPDQSMYIVVGVVLGFLSIQSLSAYFKFRLKHESIINDKHVAVAAATQGMLTREEAVEHTIHHQIAVAIHVAKLKETVIMISPNYYTERLRAVLDAYVTGNVIESYSYQPHLDGPITEVSDSAVIKLSGIISQSKAHKLLGIEEESNEQANP